MCGLFTGLAYLTRPEGAMILLAVVPVLMAMQFSPVWRLSWRRFVASGAALILVAMAVGSLYVLATGRFTPKWSVNLVIQFILTHLPFLHADAGGGGPLFAMTFTESPRPSVQFWRSVWALTLEVSNGYHYVGVLPALLGLMWSFGSLRKKPGFWASRSTTRCTPASCWRWH